MEIRNQHSSFFYLPPWVAGDTGEKCLYHAYFQGLFYEIRPGLCTARAVDMVVETQSSCGDAGGGPLLFESSPSMEWSTPTSSLAVSAGFDPWLYQESWLVYALSSLGQCPQSGAEPRALESIDGYLTSESRLWDDKNLQPKCSQLSDNGLQTPRLASQGDRASLFMPLQQGLWEWGGLLLYKALKRTRRLGVCPSASWRAGASTALGAGREDVLRSETWQGRSAGGELPRGSHCSPQTQYSTASKHIFLRQLWIINGNVKHQSE